MPEPDKMPPAPGLTPTPHLKGAARWRRPNVSEVIAGLALIVSVCTATVGWRQFKSVERQLELSELQIRPTVRYRPVFTEQGKDQLTIMMLSENLSPIPANVIYSEVKNWHDGVTGDEFVFNRTGEVLHQHKNGFTILPSFPTKIVKMMISGQMELMIGTCLVYGSISASDHRRWEVRGLYSYVPGTEFPLVQFLQDTAVGENVNRCDSSTLRSQWLERRAQPPTAHQPP